jgi:Zn-dependent peptidase ImmA (M78 family)
MRLEVQTPEKQATELRLRYWTEDNFPVDPVTIATRLGVKVLRSTFRSEVAGGLVQSAGTDPTIVIDERDSDSRKRFVVAYALGLYLHRTARQVLAPTIQPDLVILRTELLGQNGGDAEKFAFRFACELLMPIPRLGLFGRYKGQSAIALSKHFGVPIDILEQRILLLRPEGVGRGNQ